MQLVDGRQALERHNYGISESAKFMLNILLQEIQTYEIRIVDPDIEQILMEDGVVDIHPYENEFSLIVNQDNLDDVAEMTEVGLKKANVKRIEYEEKSHSIRFKNIPLDLTDKVEEAITKSFIQAYLGPKTRIMESQKVSRITQNNPFLSLIVDTDGVLHAFRKGPDLEACPEYLEKVGWGNEVYLLLLGGVEADSIIWSNVKLIRGMYVEPHSGQYLALDKDLVLKACPTCSDSYKEQYSLRWRT